LVAAVNHNGLQPLEGDLTIRYGHPAPAARVPRRVTAARRIRPCAEPARSCAFKTRMAGPASPHPPAWVWEADAVRGHRRCRLVDGHVAAEPPSTCLNVPWVMSGESSHAPCLLLSPEVVTEPSRSSVRRIERESLDGD